MLGVVRHPPGEAESACAPVLTVYSFFSDTLSPCPANWKQKKIVGREAKGRQKNQWANGGGPLSQGSLFPHQALVS